MGGMLAQHSPKQAILSGHPIETLEFFAYLSDCHRRHVVQGLSRMKPLMSVLDPDLI